ncbi:MAG: SDR family NAD(P)-dependent oxidoreductase, partial [Bacteroidales bacterium]
MKEDKIRRFTLITGASLGIGKALAAECASRGMNLFLVSLPGDGLDDFVTELEQKHGISTKYLTLDLTRSEAPQIVYDYARNMGLNINCVFNNAGIGHTGNFHDMKREEVEEMINLNLRALTSITLLFLKDMIQQNEGHILNVGSLGAYTPIAFKSVYLASKSYVYFFTAALQQEYRHTNLKFSVLMPGAVATSDHVKKRVKESGFFGRLSLLSPESVAKYTLDKMEKGKFTIMPGV